MEENVQELLKDKDENVVQFNLVNNTSSDIVVDLFESSLTTIPTQDLSVSTPPISLSSTTSSLLTGARYSKQNPNTGFIYTPYGTGVFSNIRVRDENLTFITTIPIGVGQPTDLVYCSTNNCMYVVSNNTSQVFVIDCSTNTLSLTIGGFAGSLRGVEFVPSTNEIWVTCINIASPIQIVDANTNTIVSTPVLPLSQPQDIIYYATQDWVIISSTTTNSIFIMDAVSRVLLYNIATLSPQPLGIGLVNNKVYVGYNLATTSFDVLDLTTQTFTNNVVYGGVGATIQINNFIYIPIWNIVYAYLSDGRIIGIDAITETISVIFTGLATGVNNNVFFSSTNNTLYGQRIGTFYGFTGTFVSTPFYVSGSTNYNTFVNSLNNEPIFIEEVRILTQNQTQLNNQVQFTKIDSSGNQIFFPEFPINKVDSFQEQGNIAGLKLYGLVFDGRTYINQYVINANEFVSIEIYYKQLDRFSATPTFPIFFKPKVQLKEYIKK
jgi:hypothetical protein